MIYNMTKEEFIRYLKEKNAFKSWIRQIKLLNGDAYKSNKNIIEYILKYSDRPYDIIMFSFAWDDTIEGSRFWNGLYMELKDMHYGKTSIDEISLQSPPEKNKKRG